MRRRATSAAMWGGVPDVNDGMDKEERERESTEENRLALDRLHWLESHRPRNSRIRLALAGRDTWCARGPGGVLNMIPPSHTAGRHPVGHETWSRPTSHTAWTIASTATRREAETRRTPRGIRPSFDPTSKTLSPRSSLLTLPTHRGRLSPPS